MTVDDWDPEAMPAAVTDADVREASQETQDYTRRQRLDHTAAVEAHRPTPEADPARQGAFEQKPDVQQQQVELWAYKALAYFDGPGEGGTWERFVRENELPPSWADSLVKPRFEELRARRTEPRTQGLLESTPEHTAGAGPMTEEDFLGAARAAYQGSGREEVTLEGASGPAEPPPVPIRVDDPAGRLESLPAPHLGRAALDKYLQRIAAGEIEGDPAMLERLERLAGL